MKWGNVELIDRTKPGSAPRASLAILALGGVVIASFLFFVMRRVIAPPLLQSELELAELVPAGADPQQSSLTEVSWVTTTPQESTNHSGHLFTYSLGNQSFVALVEWSPSEGHYETISTLPVAAGTIPYRAISQIARERPSARGPELYLLVANTNIAEQQVILIATIEGGVVRLLREITEDGETKTAVFTRGQEGGAERTFRMEDLDGDGVKEAVTDEAVYRFKNNIFIYDQDLSVVMRTRDSLFPGN